MQTSRVARGLVIASLGLMLGAFTAPEVRTDGCEFDTCFTDEQGTEQCIDTSQSQVPVKENCDMEGAECEDQPCELN
jgi:hypothetical protein